MNELTDEELLAKLRGVGPSAVPVLSGLPAVQAWFRANKVEPGRYEGLVASDLYRHFVEWCYSQGHKPTSHPWFLKTIRKPLGLHQGRFYDRGKERRPYMMSEECAAFFVRWRENNPSDFKLGHRGKSKGDRAVEWLVANGYMK